MRVKKRFTQTGDVYMAYLLNEGFQSFERERIEQCVPYLMPAAVNTESAPIVAAEERLEIEHFGLRPKDFTNDLHESGRAPADLFLTPDPSIERADIMSRT